MRPRLLETPQAEEASLICSTAGKGPPARDAGVTCPALHLQVKSLQCCHWHLSLTTTWRRKEKVQIQGQDTFLMLLEPYVSTECIYLFIYEFVIFCMYHLINVRHGPGV